MTIRVSDLINVLGADLAHVPVEKYTVSEFCVGAKLSRATFYRNFTGLTELYQLIFTFQVERIINQQGTKRIDLRYKALLTHFNDEKILYLNIYRQTERLFFNDVLEPLVQKNLAQFYANNAISEVSQNIIASHITLKIVRWIDDGFTKSVEEVYLEICRVLAVAENVIALL